MKTTATRRNTVETVLSDCSINNLSFILRWIWDNTSIEDVTDTLMEILAVYVKHNGADPSHGVRCVSELLQLKDQLIAVMNEEKPWDWVEVSDGWALPAKETTAK
jgi:hypothetical protein